MCWRRSEHFSELSQANARGWERVRPCHCGPRLDSPANEYDQSHDSNEDSASSADGDNGSRRKAAAAGSLRDGDTRGSAHGRRLSRRRRWRRRRRLITTANALLLVVVALRAATAIGPRALIAPCIRVGPTPAPARATWWLSSLQRINDRLADGSRGWAATAACKSVCNPLAHQNAVAAGVRARSIHHIAKIVAHAWYRH